MGAAEISLEWLGPFFFISLFVFVVFGVFVFIFVGGAVGIVTRVLGQALRQVAGEAVRLWRARVIPQVELKAVVSCMSM